MFQRSQVCVVCNLAGAAVDGLRAPGRCVMRFFPPAKSARGERVPAGWPAAEEVDHYLRFSGSFGSLALACYSRGNAVFQTRLGPIRGVCGTLVFCFPGHIR